MAPKKKEKEVDPRWEHGEMVEGDRHMVKCKWHHKTMSGGIHRFKQHLAHISREAKGCPNVSTEVRKRMRESVQGKKSEKEKKKQMNERIARMDKIDGSGDDDSDDSGDDEERVLRRAMKASVKLKKLSRVIWMRNGVGLVLRELLLTPMRTQRGGGPWIHSYIGPKL